MSLVVPTGAGLSLDRPYRPVRIVFRLHATGALRADAGDGLRRAAPGAARRRRPLLGRRRAARLGLAARQRQPPWRIAQDDPVACTILSVTSEIMGNT